jgi:hypothetical protein
MSNRLLISRPRRRLTMRDMLVLIVATAIGLAWMRAASDYHEHFEVYDDVHDHAGSDSPLFVGALNPIMWCARRAYPLFAMLALGVLFLRFAGPRVRLIRITRQPGTVACAAAVVAVAFQSSIYRLVYCAAVLDERKAGRRGVIDFDPLELMLSTSDLACAGVAFTWLLLWISGRWRNESDWIDRLGMVLGFYWLTTASLSWLVCWLAIVVA